MSELPKWLGALVAKLLPKQKAMGEHAAQFGKVGGNVTIVHLTQHLPPVAAPVQPMPLTPAGRPFRPGATANDEQRQVLQLIRRLPNSASVEKFMKREFGTHMVICLEPLELVRVRSYVEAILKAAEQDASAAKPLAKRVS